jgi:hypothetical protein
MNSEFGELGGLDSVDAEYRFGRPRVYLAPQELARLSIVRSRIGDTSDERFAWAAGDARQSRRARTVISIRTESGLNRG